MHLYVHVAVCGKVTFAGSNCLIDLSVVTGQRTWEGIDLAGQYSRGSVPSQRQLTPASSIFA